MKLKVQTHAATPDTASEWAAWHSLPGHQFNQDIDLPPDAVVAMVHEVMLRVQEGIKPQTSWILHDTAIQHYISLRWSVGSRIFELQAFADTLGMHLRLYPAWGRDTFRREIKPLVSWTCARDKGDLSWIPRGTLRLYRGMHTPKWESVELAFEHPVFADVPREENPLVPSWMTKPALPDLVSDIISVTQRILNEAV